VLPEGLGKLKKKIHSPHRVSNPARNIVNLLFNEYPRECIDSIMKSSRNKALPEIQHTVA
jgi:hypothetical protein